MTFPHPTELIPHRAPQLHLTRILEVEPGETGRILCAWEPRPEDFPGHFPGKVVVPGVAQIEAMAQALACLATLSGEAGPHVLTGVERAKFKGVCLPPCEVRVEVRVTERRFGLTWARGTVTQGGQLLCSATLQAARMPESVAAELARA